jgi:hypothetical protein
MLSILLSYNLKRGLILPAISFSSTGLILELLSIPSRECSRDIEHSDGSRYFACPFGQRAPGSNPKCTNVSFPNISRLKQHIKRTHLPKIASSGTEQSHVLQVSNGTQQAGVSRFLTSEQWGQIKTRSKSNPTEWHRICQIIFPGEHNSVSPYIDRIWSEEMRTVQSHFIQYGAKVYEELLPEVCPAHLQHHITDFQNMLRDLSPRAMTRLFHTLPGGPSLPINQQPATVSSSPSLRDFGVTSSSLVHSGSQSEGPSSSSRMPVTPGFLEDGPLPNSEDYNDGIFSQQWDLPFTSYGVRLGGYSGHQHQSAFYEELLDFSLPENNSSEQFG